MMPTGTIRRHAREGYAFIVPDQSAVDDIYVPADLVAASGLGDRLRPGQRVRYHYRLDDRGRMRATMIAIAPPFDA
jgi:cold shock CspA family protein